MKEEKQRVFFLLLNVVKKEKLKRKLCNFIHHTNHQGVRKCAIDAGAAMGEK